MPQRRSFNRFRLPTFCFPAYFIVLIVNLILYLVNRLSYNSIEMIEERRTYTLRKRAQTAERTRLRIIEAARTLLSDSGYHNVSLDTLATKAGVSRQTIYVQFGSKFGVLQALAEHIEYESYGGGMIEEARDATDPVQTIRRGITHLTHFFRRNAELLRTFYAQALSDPDFRSVWEDRQQKRWEAIHLLVKRIEHEGYLAEGWGVDEATDWLWSLTNFRLYDEMVIQRGWSPEHMAERVLQSIDAILFVKQVENEVTNAHGQAGGPAPRHQAKEKYHDFRR